MVENNIESALEEALRGLPSRIRMVHLPADTNDAEHVAEALSRVPTDTTGRKAINTYINALRRYNDMLAEKAREAAERAAAPKPATNEQVLAAIAEMKLHITNGAGAEPNPTVQASVNVNQLPTQTTSSNPPPSVETPTTFNAVEQPVTTPAVETTLPPTQVTSSNPPPSVETPTTVNAVEQSVPTRVVETPQLPVQAAPAQSLEKSAGRIESNIEEAIERGINNASKKPAKGKTGLIIGGIIAAAVVIGAFVSMNKKSEKKRPPAQDVLLQQMFQNQGQQIV